MKTINIENFYTDVNEREGVWHEPVFNGKKWGIQLLLIGIHSEEAEKLMDEYDKKSDAIRDDKKLSEEDKFKKLEELDAERMASLCKGIRASNDAELVRDGKPLEFSIEVVKTLFLNSSALKMDCVDFVLNSANFVKED